VEAASTVIASTIIQSFVAPRALRVECEEMPLATSDEEEGEAETLCQKSDVTVSIAQTSQFLNL
jgi:hypothetical protein